MSKTKLIYKCLDNPSHSYYVHNQMDGVTCPICHQHVIPTGYYDPKRNKLPSYWDLRNRRTNATDNNSVLSMVYHPNVTMNDKQLDAIFSYIQRLELYLLDAGIPLPSNREDVDWYLY